VDTTEPVARTMAFDNYVHSDCHVALASTTRLRTPFRVVFRSITVATRSEERVCGHSLAGIGCSNPTGDMNVCLL